MPVAVDADVNAGVFGNVSSGSVVVGEIRVVFVGLVAFATVVVVVFFAVFDVALSDVVVVVAISVVRERVSVG